MKTIYRVQEYRWSENMCDPQIEVIEDFDNVEDARKCFNSFENKTIGFSLQIEKLTFDEDDDLIDTENILDSWAYEGESIKGAIIVQWSWERHVGYSRNLEAIGVAGEYPFYNFKVESDLITGNEENTFRPNFSVLFSPEKALEVTKEDIENELGNGWKWNYHKRNPNSEDIQEEIGNILNRN